MEKLEVYLTFFVILFFIILTFGQRIIKFKSTRKVDQIPSKRWTSFNLPLLDGLITLYKLRTNGMKIVEEHVAEGLKFCKLDLGPKRIYFVADTDIIQKVLKSSELEHLEKPKYFYDVVFSNLVKDGLLASSVSTWIPHRKAAGLALTYKSLGIYLQYINQNVKDLLLKTCSLADQSENGRIENAQVAPLLYHSLFQLTTQIIMGSEYAAFSDQQMHEFHESFRTGKKLSVERFLSPLLLVPPIWWLHPKRRQLNMAVQNCKKFSVQVIKSYREKQLINVSLDPDVNASAGNYPNNSAPEKIEYNKLTTVKDNEDEAIGIKPFGCIVEQLIASGLADQEITDEVSTFLAAGHETINVALNMLIFHMASHPEYQRKCQVEIDQLFGSSKVKEGDLSQLDFTMDDLPSLKYLERCILESMRLTPTVPFYAREFNSPLEISKECTLDAGAIIFMAAWGVHRDPIHYPNPDVFDPDRFLAENVRKRHPYSFIPFSMGPRNCIGWKLALMEMKVYMAWILRHFNLSTTDGMNDVKISFDITIHPERPYDVTFQKRIY